MNRLASPSPPPPPPPSTELFLPPPPPPAPPVPRHSTSSRATFAGGGYFTTYDDDPVPEHPVPTFSTFMSNNMATTSFFGIPPPLPAPATPAGHTLILVIGDPKAVHRHLITEHVIGVPYYADLLPFEDYDNNQIARSFQAKCSFKRDTKLSTSSRREFSELNESVIRKLLNDLLNSQTLVTELEVLVAWAPLSTVGETVNLINALGPRLKALTFRCGPLFSDDYPIAEPSLSSTRHLITTALELMKLLQSINEPERLPKLECLTLDLRHDLRLVRPLQMPILSRLRKFSFASKGTALFLFESLMRFGEANDRLEEISIGNCTPWPAYLQYFDRSSLRERFRQLSYLPHGKAGLPPESAYLHNRFLATFTGLRSFSLSPAILSGLDLTCLASILRPLTSLEHLNLLLTQELLHRKRQSGGTREITPLLSTRVLVVQMVGFHHRQLRCFRYWRELFPNLEVLRVNHYTARAKCRFCIPKKSKEEKEIERLQREAEEEGRADESGQKEQQQENQPQNVLAIIEDIEDHRPCAAHLIAPLKACSLLRKVYYYTLPSPKGSDLFLEFTREDF